MDFQNIVVDETQAAALRGHSIDTQRRHRRLGLGPKAFKSGGRGWRYRLSEIKAEQDALANRAEKAA